MTAFPANFRALPTKAKHEALRAFFDASALKWPEDSEQRAAREEAAWSQDRLIVAIERQEARVAG